MFLAMSFILWLIFAANCKSFSSFVILFQTVVNFVSKQGSKAELEEVWKDEDGLDPDSFDPKTFFNLHGNQILPYFSNNTK